MRRHFKFLSKRVLPASVTSALDRFRRVHSSSVPDDFLTVAKRGGIHTSMSESLLEVSIAGKTRHCFNSMVAGSFFLRHTAIRRSPATPSGGIRMSGPFPSGTSTASGVASQSSSINSVSLVGVAHDIQLGFVFEESVLQFTLTTTSLQTNTLVPSLPGSSAANPSLGAGATEECVVEKDHHVVRCFGEVFSQEVQQKIKEGSVVCVSGRLRLNPQLEPSVNKYYYFPYIQVQPPYGQVAIVYTDRTNPPQPTDSSSANTASTDISAAPSPTSGGDGATLTGK